jgi:hypothetical protein
MSMNNQLTIIKDILSLYNSILENRNILEASDIYDNVDFKDYVVGNSAPSKDKINPVLLQDIQNAASAAGVKVDITTAVSGHKKGTRHETGNAVDIAIINGKAVSPSNKNDVNKFVDVLVSMGYTKNSEGANNPKSVLTFGFPGHDNHIHISNTSSKESSIDNTPEGGTSGEFLAKTFAKPILSTMGINEEKLYSSFGKNIRQKNYSYIIPKNSNSQIKSPVDGVIIQHNNSNCNNPIVIKFNDDGEYKYLQYCNISNPTVKNGRKVSKGTTIGKPDTDVIVSLYDSNNNIRKILVDKEKKSKDKESKDNDGDKNSDLYGKNEYSKLFIQSYRKLKNSLNKKNSKDTEDQKELDENINRIKKLL